MIRSSSRATISLSLLASAVLTTAAPALTEPPAESPDSAAAESTPTVDGFQQLLPRGAIPALVDPTFVAATDADLPDEAWILGFARDGQTFAYDLNLLNAHEVVNHGTESSRFAAVW